MKALFATTAIVALAAMPVLAQTTPATTAPATTQSAMPGQPMVDNNHGWAGSPEIFLPDNARGEMRATTLIRKRVYVSEVDVDETPMNDVGADWEDVGEVSDILLTRGGTLGAILVDVGGFLGIGERTVAVEMDDLRMINDADSDGDYFVVFKANRALLEDAPEYKQTSTGWMHGERTNAKDRMAQADPAPSNLAPGAVAVTPPNVDRTAWVRTEGYSDVDAAVLTAEDLEGADVYDANNESIGDVSKLIIGKDGKITQAIIDVGGFLGMGAKAVAIDYSDLLIEGRNDNKDIRVRVGATKEQLEAMPTWSE